MDPRDLEAVVQAELTRQGLYIRSRQEAAAHKPPAGPGYPHHLTGALSTIFGACDAAARPEEVRGLIKGHALAHAPAALLGAPGWAAQALGCGFNPVVAVC